MTDREKSSGVEIGSRPGFVFQTSPHAQLLKLLTTEMIIPAKTSIRVVREIRSQFESVFTLVRLVILILPELNMHSILFKAAINPLPLSPQKKGTGNTYTFPQVLSYATQHILMFRIILSVSVFIHLSIQSHHYNIVREQRPVLCTYRYSNSDLSDIYSPVSLPSHYNDEHALPYTVLFIIYFCMIRKVFHV